MGVDYSKIHNIIIGISSIQGVMCITMLSQCPGHLNLPSFFVCLGEEWENYLHSGWENYMLVNV